MTNKPMLSVELRALLERASNNLCSGEEAYAVQQELRALLDEPDETFNLQGWSIDHSAGRPILMHNKCSVIEAEQAYGLLNLIETDTQHQCEPVAWVECSPAWLKAGGDCATAPRICVGRDGISHLHPAHSIAEQPAPVADHAQCEECKGWGYHENHHEGGGTECGECGGSGKAPVEQFSADTVVCRRYQLEQHPGQNFYHYDLEPVYGSVPVTVSELITMVESAPVAVVMPERREPSPSNPHLSDADHEYNSALDDVARLNGVKP